MLSFHGRHHGALRLTTYEAHRYRALSACSEFFLTKHIQRADLDEDSLDAYVGQLHSWTMFVKLMMESSQANSLILMSANPWREHGF